MRIRDRDLFVDENQRDKLFVDRYVLFDENLLRKICVKNCLEYFHRRIEDVDKA